MNFFMKASIFVPLKNLPTAPQTAHLLLQYVFDCHGLPDHGVTDSGAQFTTWFLNRFAGLLGVQFYLLTPYHLSQMVRWNMWIRSCINIAYFTCLWDDWKSLLSLVEFAYNSMFRFPDRGLSLHAECFSSLWPSGYSDSCPKVFPWDFFEWSFVPSETPQEHLKKAKADYKVCSDRHQQPAQAFVGGDSAYLSGEHVNSEHSSKFDHHYLDLYKRMALVSLVLFHL